MIKQMHNESLIPNLNSCVKETIYSAIGRYISLGLIQTKSYSATNGSQTTFLSSSVDARPVVDKTFDLLTTVYKLSKTDLNLWGESISIAVESSLVVKIQEIGSSV